MGILTNYSPELVDIVWNGITLLGFADGTFVVVERETDTFSKKIGSLGDCSRTRSLNRSGKITITLMDTHPVNDLLAIAIAEDERTGLGFGAFTLKDRSGNAEVRATEAWCMRVPKLERAQTTGHTVYVFEAASIFIKHSGTVI